MFKELVTNLGTLPLKPAPLPRGEWGVTVEGNPYIKSFHFHYPPGLPF